MRFVRFPKLRKKNRTGMVPVRLIYSNRIAYLTLTGRGATAFRIAFSSGMTMLEEVTATGAA